jgi:CheY-like chemotaxis protein
MGGPGLPRLLIVEDDDNMRTLLTAAASKSGVFQLWGAAEDGEAAMSVLRESFRKGDPDALPDAIVSDLKMPRMDGIELLRELKKNSDTAQIPVAIVTSSDEPNDRGRAMQEGCCAFMNKPTGMNALVAVLQSVAEHCLHKPAAAS